MSRECKPGTYNLRLIYLRTFFKWAAKEGIFPENPLEGFQKKKDEGRIVDTDTDTLEQLLSIPDKTTFSGLRDYAFLLLTLDTGIRPGEAFLLLPDDFNFKSLTFHVAAACCHRAAFALFSECSLLETLLQGFPG